MCKIAVMPGISQEYNDNAWKLIKELSEEMSAHDDDGFGYAAIDGEGKMFGERWFNPKDSFKTRGNEPPKELDVEEKFKGFLKPASKFSAKGGYSNFGDVHEKSVRTAILHARKSTNERTLQNVHPFVIDSTALIHNGVIGNQKELNCNKISTCDSEVILAQYLKYDVANNIKNIQKVIDALQGWWAVAILSRQKDGRLILDVFKDSATKLRGYYIKEIEGLVLGTTGTHETWGPVPNAVRDCKFTITQEFEIEANKVLRLDAMTGEKLEVCEYEPYSKKSGKRRGDITVYSGDDVRNAYARNFGKSNEHHRGAHSWETQRKEDEIERMLCEGDFCQGEGYEMIYGEEFVDHSNDIPDDDADETDDDKTPVSGFTEVAVPDGKSLMALPPIPNHMVKSIGDKLTKWGEDFFMDEHKVWHHKKTASAK